MTEPERYWPDDTWLWRHGGWVLGLPITIPMWLFFEAKDRFDDWRWWREWDRQHGLR